MIRYYCHECGLAEGLFRPLDVDQLDLTGSVYQLEKFIKHTTPVNFTGIVSIFDDSSYERYKDFVVSTSASGSVEVDDRGRTNVIYFAGKNIGVTYQNGDFSTNTDTVKVVLHDNAFKIHSFPVDSFEYETKKCRNCERDILY